MRAFLFKDLWPCQFGRAFLLRSCQEKTTTMSLSKDAAEPERHAGQSDMRSDREAIADLLALLVVRQHQDRICGDLGGSHRPGHQEHSPAVDAVGSDNGQIAQ